MHLMIGEKIKELRREQNMTQETLADLLHVSYQAVSKWENGVTCPDLGLIVPLARIFHISTDELLGMTRYETNERRAYFDALHENYWHYEADFERLAAAREAVAEFPEDMTYREWLGNTLYYCAFQDPATMTAMMDECIEHSLIVWEQDKTPLRYDALWTVVLAYTHSGRKEQAKQYALLFPEKDAGYANRDRALTNCLKGEELLLHNKCLNRLSTILSKPVAHFRISATAATHALVRRWRWRARSMTRCSPTDAHFVAAFRSAPFIGSGPSSPWRTEILTRLFASWPSPANAASKQTVPSPRWGSITRRRFWMPLFTMLPVRLGRNPILITGWRTCVPKRHSIPSADGRISRS